jgi:hypothetical protein
MATPINARANGATPKVAATTKGKDTAKQVTDAKAVPPPKIKTGKLFMGMAILFVAMSVIQLGLGYLDLSTNRVLSKNILFTLPLLGNITPLVVLFMAITVLMYWVFIRFGILPRGKDMVTMPEGATSNSTATGKSITAKSSTAKTTTTTLKNGSKTAISGRVAATTGKLSKTTTISPRGASFSGENDNIYEQVRAQLRTQSRKKKK